jgi:hypothetical protein
MAARGIPRTSGGDLTVAPAWQINSALVQLT